VASDIDGQLLGEYTSTGSPIREYIYLEGERVAMYDHTTVEPKDSTNTKAIVYLHNDQVGQVQYAYNSDGQIIYERVQTPFGETMSEMNAYNVQIPVRFPGQYYDSETGFNQNWNRDYDSSLGRYVQSDPIGLMGGINTYGYVMQNPGMWVDLMGLKLSITGGGSITKSGDGAYKSECSSDWSDDVVDEMNRQCEGNPQICRYFDELINSPYDNTIQPYKDSPHKATRGGDPISETADRDDNRDTSSPADIYLYKISDVGHEAGHGVAENNGTHTEGADKADDTHNLVIMAIINGPFLP
jgi:RHS repeat-associated protein